MKKILLSLLIGSFSMMAYAQPVSDNAIIPVSVYLSGILRLNVTSGGNIDFQVNTLDQYENGIANSANYDTQFNVASSTDFDVVMTTEDAVLGNTDYVDTTGHSMPLNNLAYDIVCDGTHTDGTEVEVGTEGTYVALATSQTIVTGAVGSSAGGIEDNAFTINWQLAVMPGAASGSLLSQSIPSGRYSTNVFLTLVGK